jgi:PAS domain S-box-containing protein
MFSPVQYKDQKAVLANIRDINHRKLVEETLRKSEEKYRNLIDSSPAGIFIIEGETLLYVNPSGARNLGFRASDEIIGKSIFKFIAPEYKNIALARLKRVQSRMVYQPDQIKLFKKDGKEMWLEMVSLPFEYYNSAAILVMGFDITERKKAEDLILQKNKEIERRNFEYSLLNQKLKMAKEKAEESDRLKSAFLSNMSHEIRTPMNAILGFSDLLIKKKIPEDKRMEYIGIINSSGNQLLSLINDIIDISKIESNQIIIDNSTQINIVDIFRHLLVIFQAKSKNNKVQLDFTIHLDEKQTKFYLDEIRLNQILVNLIGNAIKFTQNGFVKFDVSLQNGELLFSVEDSGIGIEPSLQTVIFDRFRQADGSTTRDFGGTGLGLAISKALVELMGGKIWLTSALGKGTTFYFTMPFRLGEGDEDTDLVEVNNDDNYIWKNQHILLVEDEEANILFLTELLQPAGLKVTVARNADEAYSFMKKYPKISLVLMDIKIPKVDGYQITDQIKKNYPGIIIIAQTAYALAEERKRIMSSGFDDYISKPIGKTLLFNMLAKYLDN